MPLYELFQKRHFKEIAYVLYTVVDINIEKDYKTNLDYTFDESICVIPSNLPLYYLLFIYLKFSKLLVLHG